MSDRQGNVRNKRRIESERSWISSYRYSTYELNCRILRSINARDRLPLRINALGFLDWRNQRASLWGFSIGGAERSEGKEADRKVALGFFDWRNRVKIRKKGDEGIWRGRKRGREMGDGDRERRATHASEGLRLAWPPTARVNGSFLVGWRPKPVLSI